MELEFKRISNVEFEGVDTSDAPDFCDAFVVSAYYDDEPMTQDQIEELNDDSAMVYDLLIDYLY